MTTKLHFSLRILNVILMSLYLTLLVGCVSTVAPSVTATAQDVVTKTPSQEAQATATVSSALSSLENCENTIQPGFDRSITLIHTPPTLLHADAVARLEFRVLCSNPDSQACQPKATLYATWGDKPFEEYTHISSVDLPAMNTEGQPLRYYVQMENTQSEVTSRYPRVGCIEPVIVSSFAHVGLSKPEKASSQLALQLPWGTGDGQVGLRPGSEGPTFGPAAFDVGSEGSIGILDSVNQRILLYRTSGDKISSIPLPEPGAQDIEIDEDGQIAVLERTDPDQSGMGAKVLLFDSEGQLLMTAPVHADLPDSFVGILSVLDLADYQVIAPVDNQNHIRTRDEQYATRTKLQLTFQGLDTTHIDLADTANSLFFELKSEVDFGAVAQFGRTLGGYVVVFQKPDETRIVWLDKHGGVLGDKFIPTTLGEWIHPGSSIAIDENGAIYILSSTGNGVEILHVDAPVPFQKK